MLRLHLLEFVTRATVIELDYLKSVQRIPVVRSEEPEKTTTKVPHKPFRFASQGKKIKDHHPPFLSRRPPPCLIRHTDPTQRLRKQLVRRQHYSTGFTNCVHQRQTKERKDVQDIWAQVNLSEAHEPSKLHTPLRTRESRFLRQPP